MLKLISLTPLFLLAALFDGRASASVPPPIPTFSPPACQVESRWTGHRSSFGQYLIQIRLPDACPPRGGRLARIRTARGAVLPPVGYFRLGAGFPRAVTFWVLSPAYVQDRAGPNDWRTVPIRRAPWPSLEAPWDL